MSYNITRASEISAYLYCRRAWWLQRTGVKPGNISELARGNDYHQQHSQSVNRTLLIQRATLIFFFVGIGLLAYWLARNI
jgi:hypothetical protein